MGSVREDIAMTTLQFVLCILPERKSAVGSPTYGIKLNVCNYSMFAMGSVRADIACGYIPMSGAELL